MTGGLRADGGTHGGSTGGRSGPARERPAGGRDGPASDGWEAGPPIPRESLAAAAVGLLAALGIGVAAGGALPALLAVGAGVGLAASVALVTRDAALLVALGTLVGIPSLAGIAVAAALGPTAGTLAVAMAAFGAGAVPVRGVGRGRYVEALGLLTVGLVPLGVTALGSALWPVGGALANGAIDAVGGGGPGTALLSTSILGALAAVGLRAGLRALPAAELAAREDRAAVAAAVASVEARLDAALRYALGGGALGIAVWILVALELIPRASAAVGLLTLVLGLARWLLFVALVAGLVAAATARTVRWSGSTLLDRTRRAGSAAAGVVLTLALAAAADRVLFAAIEAGPDGVGQALFGLSSELGTLQTTLLSATALLLAAVFASLLLPALAGIGVAPRRAFAPALSAAGLVGVSVATAGSAGPVATFGAVAAAMAVWDLGEHAVGVGEEVGEAASRTPQVIHAGAGVWVGLVSAVFAWGLYQLVRAASGAGSDPLALGALAAAVVGVLALVAALRG